MGFGSSDLGVPGDTAREDAQEERGIPVNRVLLEFFVPDFAVLATSVTRKHGRGASEDEVEGLVGQVLHVVGVEDVYRGPA